MKILVYIKEKRKTYHTLVKSSHILNYTKYSRSEIVRTLIWKGYFVFGHNYLKTDKAIGGYTAIHSPPSPQYSGKWGLIWYIERTAN